MPTITVERDLFFADLGKTYSHHEFDELCFQYGLELDEDTSITAPDERPHKLKIEVAANRYDLLCHEGLVRALRLYLELDRPPQYRVLPWQQGGMSVTIAKETAAIRPYFAGAILRNIRFTPASYASFIDLQDKLHMNLARRRTFVAIGTHDLDSMAPGDVTYEALPPKQIKFVPLGKDKEYDAAELMELYESDRHLSRFLHIIRDSPVYPILYDAARQVCSMPPIINSEKTKITLNTRNVFIDTTATDPTKLGIVIDTIVTMFSQHCAKPFVVEPVRVVFPDGREVITPNLEPRPMICKPSYVDSYTALGLAADQVAQLLEKMGHSAQVAGDDRVNVLVPPTRHDILHQCDLVEDVAIAYGFDRLTRTFPRTSTIAAPLPINKLGDIVRNECARSGWVEALPLILCSRDENFAHLGRPDDGTAVALANPKTAEYQIIRTSVLPGLLKTVRENRKHPLPLRVFECSDVALKDSSVERQSRNERHLGAVYCARRASFEIVHGLLDRIMLILGLSKTYRLEAVDDGMFLPGRGAKIMFAVPTTAADGTVHLMDATADEDDGGKKSALDSIKDTLGAALSPTSKAIEIGRIGVLHPRVLSAYELVYPASVLELNVQALP